MNITRILIILALAICVILLQIFLSKRKSKWPGLVLPMMAFLFSLLIPLNMTAFGGITLDYIFQLLLVWLIGNIPTIVLLTIYFSCREKQRKKKQIEKMNIQDLN